MERDNKVGLVLEGGGMRGMYTAGVLDVFMEEGLMPDGVIGVSAGAIHGCNFLAQQYGRSVRYNLKYINDKRYVSLKSLITTGDLFNVEFCYDTIPNELNKFDYDKFKEIAKDVPFYVGCTNVETGEPEYIRCTDLKEEMNYLRASASLPLVSKIVEVGDKKLLDGGVSDSIPMAFFRKIGFKKNIVVLTRPEGYEKKADPTIGVVEKVYSKYPNLVEACRERSESYNRTVDYIEYYERQGQAIIIRPSKEVKIGRVEKNTNKLKYMYKLGRYDTKKKLDKIKEFMA
ncbi:MAG: patatin family protein [Lachnospiraceae bacterium]|nr:patatin family protein [Lachnospiraceae bacterium]